MTKQNGKIQRSKNRTVGSPSSTESCQMEDESRPIPDLSILRKSIQTSITGFTQARDVFDTGTEELKEMLSSECDVIYECRVCRNLFRSLANFISHKRVYCRQKFNTSLHAHFINNKFLKDDMMMILQNEQDYQNFLNNKNTLENEKQFKISNVTNKSTAKDLTSIVERLASKNKNTSNLENSTSSKPPPERLIKFQSITSSPMAVYQNVCSSQKDLQDLIKDQVTELDNMISSREAILGPDGKLLLDTISSAPKSNDAVIQISDEDEENTGHEIVCKICKIKFATLKTLRFHMKHKHAPNRLVFPCPDCSDTFANAWGVYRHLFKVHRKSAAHIRKLRDSIQNKAYRLQKPTPSERKPETPQETESMSEQHRMDLENQAWMDNLETDGEVPRCGGCGRRFERRAALSSHRQTCQLRIAAQNKISSNLQRRVVTKAVPKEPPEPPQTPRMPAVEPRIKIPKLDIKPSEKTIEIQIRRDYNKGSTASPVSLGTNSPVSEPAGDGDVATPLHSSESSVKERELASGSANTNWRSKGFLESKGAHYSPQRLPRSPTIGLPESSTSRKGGHEAESTAHDSARPSSFHRPHQPPPHLTQVPSTHLSTGLSSQRFHRGDSSSEDSGGEDYATLPQTFDDIRQIIFGQISSENWNSYTVNTPAQPDSQENRNAAKEGEAGATEPSPEVIQK